MTRISLCLVLEDKSIPVFGRENISLSGSDIYICLEDKKIVSSVWKQVKNKSLSGKEKKISLYGKENYSGVCQ